MAYHIEIFSDEFISLEPYKRFWGDEATMYEHDGYAVLVRHPVIGLAWIHMTNIEVGKVLWHEPRQTS